MLNGAEQAIASLAQIDSLAKSLGNKTVKVTVSSTGITRAANQAEKLNTNLVNAAKAGQQIGTAVPQSIGKAAKTTEEAAKSAKNFSLGIGSVVGNMIKIQAVNAAINGTVRAVKFAVNEMKAVDTEMVNIRKATGFSADEMDRLSKSAYSLATQYGRTASEVLQGGTTFARAGYTDQIEQLSELSLLLQNVGDLQADDAAKFIVATDKAYKLGGSYESLMAIIDGLDNITNRNATDMQKMTDGMTIAGSVFAESGETIETFAALLGTATANTQRSGSEVARGLRTILMNLRQIRGETEDGELIDGESIAAAAKALKDYAGISTMENGQLRKASDVLTELAGKWDTLSETQRAAIAEAVAGKRQANILMSLMGDWESVTKMMQEYETAAGTAAGENAAYMDSWAAKTEQVKAAWTELVQNVVDSDFFKNLLDSGTGFLQWVNSAFIPAEEKLTKEVERTKQEAENLTEEYQRLFGEGSRYDELIGKVNDLTEAEKIELGVLEMQRVEREKTLQAAKEAAEEAAKRAEIQARQAEADRTLAARTQPGMQALSIANSNFMGSGDIKQYTQDIAEALQKSQELYTSLQNLRASGTELLPAENQFVAAYEYALKTYQEGGNAIEVLGKNVAATSYAVGEDWETAREKANSAMKTMAKWYEEGEYPWKGFVPNIDLGVEVKGAEEAADTMDRLKEQAEEGANFTITVGVAGAGALGAFGNLFKHFASGTNGAPGGPALVNENGPELIAANGLAWIAGGGAPTVTMLPQGATVLTAQETRRAFGGMIPAFASGTGAGGGGSTGGESKEVESALVDVLDELVKKLSEEDGSLPYKPLRDEEPTALTSSQSSLPSGRKTAVEGEATGLSARGPSKWTKPKKIYDPATGQNVSGTGTGSGGAAAPDFKTLEKELDDRLKNLDLQAKLAENEEDFLKAMQIYGEAQGYISELLDTYRAAGYAEDSTEVLKLANLGYDYAAKQLGGYDDLQKRLIDALNALTEATDDANELQERQQAVEDARTALRNAESQRTVRVFNPVTGQWEWVANASDVQRAQQALASAEESLQKEELRQALEALKSVTPEELEGMTLSPAILQQISQGTAEQQAAFWRELGGAYGGASYLGSDAARTDFNQGSTTNIDAQYFIDGIQLTEHQAEGMSVKQLVDMLHGARLMQ